MIELDSGFQLHLGDCLQIMKGMPGGSVDAVVTDPPYGIGRVWKGGASCGWASAQKQTSKRNEWDDKPPSKEVFDTILSTGNTVIIWGGNYFELPTSRGWLVWVKPERGFTLSEAELAWTNMDMPMRVFEHRRSDRGRVHPTQKPLGLMKWCITKYTKESDTVLDPFMGSGTTGVACHLTGRNFIGIEIDPDYFAIAEKRIREVQMQPLLF